MLNNVTKTARAVRFRETGGPEVLTIENVEVRAPGPQEVRLQVKAIGINRADAMYREGFYVETPIFPAGLGYEAAGIIEAVGAEVYDFKAGDVVSILPAFSLNDYNTYGELILVPAYTLQKYPDVLSPEEAASVWTSFLSMYGLLVDSAKLTAGQFVIITAASSNAGLAAIQMVNLLGGISIAITSTNSKKDLLVAAGASHVIVTADQDLEIEVKRITPKGADIILDPVGGPLFAKLIATVAQKGQVFIYGALSRETAVFPTLDVLIKLPTIKGYTATDVFDNPAVLQAGIQFITSGIAQGKLKPIIAKSFSLDQVVEAHRYMESNRQFGKVVISVA